MKTVLNLLEEDVFPSLENTSFELVQSDQSISDVIVCGLEHIEFVGAIANPEETFFIIALNDPVHEKALIPSAFHAWISRSRLERLPEMLDIYRANIDKKSTIRETRALMERFIVDTSVHHANLDGIKKSMRESTKEIETIFEARVQEMRSIHTDTQSAHEQLTRLKEQIVPEVFEDLQSSWEITQSILKRTDDVIKAMFGFISVLQCEDRISQMIDGIENIMNDDIGLANENGYYVSYANETELKNRLIPYYTIQDQRDYVLGEEDAMKGCKPESVDIDDFILF